MVLGAILHFFAKICLMVDVEHRTCYFHTKGQSFSKANYLVLNSPKKRTKIFYPRILATRIEVFRSVFGRIENKIICFRDLLTFIYCCCSRNLEPKVFSRDCGVGVMATRANTLIIFSAELYCWPLPASPLFAKMWWASVLCYILCFSVSSLSAQIFRGHNWMKNRFLDQTAEQSRFWSYMLFAKMNNYFISLFLTLLHSWLLQ